MPYSTAAWTTKGKKCHNVLPRNKETMRSKRKGWPPAFQPSMKVLAYTVVLVYLFGHVPTLAEAECFGGIETYEKTTGKAMTGSDPHGLLHQPGAAITRDCNAVCKRSPTCNAFTVDYSKSTCVSFEQDSVGKREKLRDDPRTNYFEKVCYRGITNFQQICGDRLWAFERVVGAFLDGFDDKEERSVQSKSDCQKLCLTEKDFVCRSAEYDEKMKICKMSREDRRTQPSAFRHQPGIQVDYLENQCVKQLPDCRYLSRQSVSVISMDELQYASSKEDCQTLCDQSRVFTCRAISFSSEENRCFLSADDSVSLMGASLPHKRGAVFSEKQCSINNCEGGLFTFEKVTGHFLRTAKQEPITLTSSAPGATLECVERCKDGGADCPAFIVDHSAMRCFKLDRNTQGRGEELTRRDGQNYFEKICLRGNIQGCRGKAWAFERRPARELRGHDSLVIHHVPSRRDCEERCLAETRFLCRSAEYHTQTTECRLSREDRRTRPNDFVEAPMHIEYLENQCIEPNRHCSYSQVQDSHPHYLDTVINGVPNEAECRMKCNNMREFNCRSFSYYATHSQCFISGDDRASGGDEAVQKRTGTTYNEKDCKGRPGQPIHHQHVSNGIPDRPSLSSGGFIGTNTIDDRNPYSGITDTQIGRCVIGRMTYEKVSGYELDRGDSFLLYRDAARGISDRCAKRCQSDDKCHAFNLDYNRKECSALEFGNDEVRYDLRRSSGVAYFEGICLRGGGCGLQWTFERIPNFQLTGFDQEIYRDVGKTQCEDRCLEERRFMCRSASYDWKKRECRLSREDRFTQPRAFRPSPDSDYLENQCAPQSRKCSYKNVQRDRYLIYVDKSESARTDVGCQRACDKEREFNCRSFSFLPSVVGANPTKSPIGTGPLCLLSGNTASNAEPNAFQVQPGAIYSERECDPRDIPGTGSGSNGAYTSETRPYPPGRDPYPADPRPYPPTSRHPFPPSGRDHYSSSGGRDRQYHSSRYPATSRIPYPARERDYYTGRHQSSNYVRDPYPSRDPYRRDPYVRDRNRDPYPSPYPGSTNKDFGNYLDPDLSPYRCRYTVTYEKVMGYTYNGARKETIPVRNDIGITGECLNECDRLRERCLAVSVEPLRSNGQRCYSLDRSSEADSSLLHPSSDLIHFEKICLVERGCGKAWTFTRVPEHELVGPGDLEIRNIYNRRQCQDECLRSPRGPCRSATYYERDRLCKLSSETRRTRPENFRQASPDVDYMENECAPAPPHCEYADTPGRYLPSADKFLSRIYNAEDCRRACDTEQEFNCLAFSYRSYRRECLLSADDTHSTGQALIPDPEFFYGEKGSCNNVRVDCTPSDMMVTINFATPFSGRVFATGNPQSCFEMGGERSQVVLRISLGTQCGTLQQDRGRYVNHVVIQQNPVIMQESDKTVRVECSFDANDQTVSYAPNGGPGSRDHEGGGISVTVPFRPTGTNIVTGAAPTPNVRMRIVMRNGQDASVVGLGEELQLRIEIDPSSAFGIFARNLEARTEYGELLTLIDNIGCPRDPNVFPEMQAERGTRNLFADFKAFRFPSTATVNFVATVQFCQDLCQPVRCQGGIESFGKRRRRRSLSYNLENATDIIDHDNDDEVEGESSLVLVTMATPTVSLPTRNKTIPFNMSTTAHTKYDRSNYNIFEFSKQAKYVRDPNNTSTQTGRKEEYEIMGTSENKRKMDLPATRSPPVYHQTRYTNFDNNQSAVIKQTDKKPALQSLKEPEKPSDEKKTDLKKHYVQSETATTTPPPVPQLPNALPISSRLVVLSKDDANMPLDIGKNNNIVQSEKFGNLTSQFFPPVPSRVTPSQSTYDGYVCSTKGSVVGAIITVILMQAGILATFWYFYRSKQREWLKLTGSGTGFHDVHTLHHQNHSTSSSSHSSSSSPEVIFRSVYDRLSAGGRRPFLIPFPNHQHNHNSNQS